MQVSHGCMRLPASALPICSITKRDAMLLKTNMDAGGFAKGGELGVQGGAVWRWAAREVAVTKTGLARTCPVGGLGL